MRYPQECPHCGESVREYYPEDVRKAKEKPTMQVGEYGPGEDAMTYETETWYRVNPCGCLVPPEEHASFQTLP